ncbi:MAG: hypothetical protein ACXAC5_03860 [Promethearchaeota archaeon]|jgi:hypothetical protein
MRNWLHSKTEVQNRRVEFLGILMNQYRQARTGLPDCACCDKSVDSWTKLYRCFQCDIWLCKSCTRLHMPEVERV